MPGAVDFAVDAERMGVDSLWVPEVWGYDALTAMAYLAAKTERVSLGTFIVQLVVQLGSRSPALLATSGLSLQQLSGGRFILGIGVSGPQVMEGWHGVRFRKPVQATRETVDIIRTISAGERLSYDGEVYQLPLPDSTGKALRPMVIPEKLPVYIAAMGPRNLELTGEVADGWIGNAFMPEAADVFFDPIRTGAARTGRTLADLDILAPAAVQFVADDAERDAAARGHADGYAFTIGAMGGAGSNFYADAFSRLGFADEVATVARLWRDGDKEAAQAAVPVEFGVRTNLIGTPDEVTDRLRAYADTGVTTLLAKLDGPLDRQRQTIRTLMECVDRM
ncbi:FMN-dependent monooxygenase [Gordonia spumicola]|uniref:FMN-dependent monooxygenase n=1 Tax=Gordonia spumicola TaxID=589161 RepID=A0A7I9V5E6_9ACTN|nr:FMN-dependent monooxygenase [Gordonia spumicola]GEE04170.1 FMN-dependent monooxygenase [Gordonia spumicola]